MSETVQTQPRGDQRIGGPRTTRVPLPAWAKPILGVLMVGIPIFFIGMGGWGIGHVTHEQSLLRPVQGGLQTEGQIISEDESCYRSCTYTPTIQFMDLHGGVHQFTAPPSQDYLSEGTSVTVSYNPANPSEAHDLSDGGSSSWNLPLFTSIFFIAISGLFLAFAGTTTVRRRRRGRNLTDQQGAHLDTVNSASPSDHMPSVSGQLLGPALDDAATAEIRRRSRRGWIWIIIAVILVVPLVVLVLANVSYEAYTAKVTGLTWIACFIVIFGWVGIATVGRAAEQGRTLSATSWRRIPSDYVRKVQVGNGARYLLLIPSSLDGGGRILTLKSMTKWRMSASGLKEAHELEIAGNADHGIVARVPGHAVLLSFRPAKKTTEDRWRAAFA